MSEPVPDDQPSSARPRRLPVIPIVLVLLLAGGAGWYLTHRSPAAPAGDAQSPGKPGAAADGAAAAGKKGGRSGAPSIVVGKVHVRDFDVWADSLGTVTSYYNVTIHTRVDGPLLRVNFREGQRVKAGELLAEIDPRTFQAALDQANATTARDQALLANAKVDLARYKDLADHDAVPRQTYDTQVSLVNQYEATVKTDQAAAESARLTLSFCRILAPISGQMGLRQIDPGNMVHAADTTGLVSMAQMDPISVLFSLPQDMLPQVLGRLHSRQAIRLEAFDRAGSQLLARGTLGSVDNQIDTTTGAIKLRGRFDNKDDHLYPNQFVNVRILMDTRRNAVVAPSAALLRGADGTYVYVLNADRTVSVRPVTAGPADRGEVVIEKGLADGEQVVTDGTDKLREGMAVVLADAKGGAGPRTDAAAGGAARRGRKPGQESH